MKPNDREDRGSKVVWSGPLKIKIKSKTKFLLTIPCARAQSTMEI